MNIDQAIEILDQATQPQLAGQLTRQDYAKIQAALDYLRVLRQAFAQQSPKPDDKPPAGP